MKPCYFNRIAEYEFSEISQKNKLINNFNVLDSNRLSNTQDVICHKILILLIFTFLDSLLGGCPRMQIFAIFSKN